MSGRRAKKIRRAARKALRKNYEEWIDTVREIEFGHRLSVLLTCVFRVDEFWQGRLIMWGILLCCMLLGCGLTLAIETVIK